MPNGNTTLDALAGELGKATGLYIFPGFGLSPNASKAEQHEAMKHMDERAARYPSGIMMYHPPGGRPMMMGRWLSVEFVTEFLEVLLAVWLLIWGRRITLNERQIHDVPAGVAP